MIFIWLDERTKNVTYIDADVILRLRGRAEVTHYLKCDVIMRRYRAQ
jgi:hypothetical protein